MSAHRIQSLNLKDNCGAIAGMDLVVVASDDDHSGSTAILAAQVLMNTIGRMLHHRG